MSRLTNAEVTGALQGLQRALAAHGWELQDGEDLALAAPYGHVWYVVRYVPHAAGRGMVPVHDVPGFMGSGGSGFITRREAVDAIRQVVRTLWDLVELQRADSDSVA